MVSEPESALLRYASGIGEPLRRVISPAVVGSSSKRRLDGTVYFSTECSDFI
jgi:hypothetical protein